MVASRAHTSPGVDPLLARLLEVDAEPEVALDLDEQVGQRDHAAAGVQPAVQRPRRPGVVRMVALAPARRGRARAPAAEPRDGLAQASIGPNTRRTYSSGARQRWPRRAPGPALPVISRPAGGTDGPGRDPRGDAHFDPAPPRPPARRRRTRRARPFVSRSCPAFDF